MKSVKIALAMAITLSAASAATAEEHLKSLDPKGIDNSIPAGKDFYSHVNKRWQEAHPLTDEYARYGQFNILRDTSEARVKEIVLNLGASNPEPGSVL